MNIGALTPLQRMLVSAGGALLLPVIVILALQLRNDFVDRQRAVEQAALASAENLLAIADARAAADLKILYVLATSRDLAARDWEAAQERAATVVELNPGWRAITLTDTAARQVVFDTGDGGARGGPPNVPPKSEMPPGSGIVNGVSRAGRHCPCVLTHMRLGALPDHVLTLYVDPQVFQSMLVDRQRAGSTSGLVDRDGRFLARSMDYRDRVGTPGTGYVREAVARGGSGLYPGETYEGMLNYTAYATSDLTGWSAHVAIDRALLDWPRALSTWTMLGGAIVALALAGGLVAYAVRDMAVRQEEERHMLELQKTEALGHFTATVVHDFNNLLAVVQAGLNQIIRHTGEAETVERAERTRAAIQRGSRLTNQLLSLARGEATEVTAVDLPALLGNLDELLHKSLGRGIALEVGADPGAARVLVNPDQLELALVNLAVNARDAMDGQGRLSITTAPAGDDMVEIRVTDTGPGIPPEVQGQLFRPFFSTKPPGKGTGLGLAQVAGTAHQAGGSVEAVPGPDGGACFVLRLRAAPPNSDPDTSAPALADAPST